MVGLKFEFGVNLKIPCHINFTAIFDAPVIMWKNHPICNNCRKQELHPVQIVPNNCKNA